MFACGRPSFAPEGNPGSTAPSSVDLPEGFHLDDGFLDDASASRVLEELSAETPWEDHTFTIFGRTVPMPRRIAWYGDHAYGYSGVIHPARPLSPQLEWLRDAVAAATGHPFNCVLLNLYRGGSDSMGWHADDDYEAGPHTGVASLSLGATRRFRLRSRDADRRSIGMDLTHGSLLFMGPGTQAAWHHAVTRTARKVGVRINLTFRHLIATNIRT
ncbi:MAG: alpha-ketoglutarate-dependent dioxygenase AlkB [Myxococcota bacterium]|nr:alpha-ketoglutarate-dependent dioxygenase AlkB [Myxococcota bacterium]